MPPEIDLKKLLLHDLGLKPDECRGMTAVVTGAGRGIGLQTARAFALLGARAVIAELSTENGQAAMERIRAEGGQATFVATDVSDAETVKRLASASRDRPLHPRMSAAETGGGAERATGAGHRAAQKCDLKG